MHLDASATALAALERIQPRLGAGDRARACSHNDPRERRRRLAAYMALRVVLERVAGRAARGRTLVRRHGAKPQLPGGRIDFSLAHAGSLALIGVTAAGTVGVDLEPIRPIKISQRRRAELMAAAAGLADTDPPATGSTADAAFMQAWSRLEAYAKARGAGLERTLSWLGLRDGEARQQPLEEIEARARRLGAARGIAVSDLALPAGFAGAVALPRKATGLRPRVFPTHLAAIIELLPSYGRCDLS